MTAPARLTAHLQARVGRFELDARLDTAGGTLVLAGPNGAGKTTTLWLLLGLLPCERGRLALGDTVLLDTTAGVEVPVERRGIGFVPQDCALLPHLTVRENIAFAVNSARSRGAPGTPAERRERIERTIRELDVTALANRLPATLSGGERQRAAVARALAVAPAALLLDEPFAALDVGARRQVRAFLTDVLAARALPTIIVTHDAEDARALGHRIAVMESGRVVQAGTWDDLHAHPASSFVADFVTSAKHSGRLDDA